MKKIILGGISIWLLMVFFSGVTFTQEIQVSSDNKEKTIVESLALKIFSPDDKLVTYQSKILVQGKSYFKEIWINNLQLNTNKKDDFKAYLDLKLGKNNILFKNKGQAAYRRILRLPYFTDLPQKHFAKNALEELTLLSYFNDTSKKIYPKNSITRSEMAKILVKLASLPIYKVSSQAKQLFNDVTWRTHDVAYIYAVAQNKIMAGAADGKFYPNKKVTKAEAVVLLVRAENLEIPKKVENLPFDNIPHTHWAAPFLQTAVENNIITARKKFNINSIVSRGEMALMLSRLPSVKKKIADLRDWEKGYQQES